MAPPNALTIAGFDPSGGAGVLADCRTFESFGYRASAVVTSITFQNNRQGLGAEHQNAASVRHQIESLLAETQFVCAKTGMLPTGAVVREVARLFRDHKLPAPIVDPVMIATSGLRLMEAEAFEVFIAEILPLARLVTPNISEAEVLARMTITNEREMREAAKIIRGRGARAVLVKGGHLNEQQSADDVPPEAIDFLDDDGSVATFRAQFIPGAKLHGSGCIMSAAIAAGVGKGNSLENSVRAAKGFVLQALKMSEE